MKGAKGEKVAADGNFPASATARLLSFSCVLRCQLFLIPSRKQIGCGCAPLGISRFQRESFWSKEAPPPRRELELTSQTMGEWFDGVDRGN